MNYILLVTTSKKPTITATTISTTINTTTNNNNENNNKTHIMITTEHIARLSSNVIRVRLISRVIINYAIQSNKYSSYKVYATLAFNQISSQKGR